MKDYLETAQGFVDVVEMVLQRQLTKVERDQLECEVRIKILVLDAEARLDERLNFWRNAMPANKLAF